MFIVHCSRQYYCLYTFWIPTNFTEPRCSLSVCVADLSGWSWFVNGCSWFVWVELVSGWSQSAGGLVWWWGHQMGEFMWRTTLHITINNSEREWAETVHDDSTFVTQLWRYFVMVFCVVLYLWLINLHKQLDLDHVTWISVFPNVPETLRVVNHFLSRPVPDNIGFYSQ